MSSSTPIRFARRPRRRADSARSRGVVSVVSMMFLILFGSLAAAMAIMSKGNILTAATHQHVVRALGAAETGLGVALQRLEEAAGRFVVEKGTIDGPFGTRLWRGQTLLSDGQVLVQAPTSYLSNSNNASSIAEAVMQIHDQDHNIVTDQSTVTANGLVTSSTLTTRPNTADPSVYASSHWVRTPAVALNPIYQGQASGTAFQIDYAPLADGLTIRAIITGYDFDYGSRGRPVTRRITQDFSLAKRVDAAVLSPSKIMVGKNVRIEGDLGCVYTDVAQAYGDPLIMKSDFLGLEAGLDTEINKLITALRSYDVDKDNRLRVGHPIEGPGIPDYSNLGYSGTAADVTGDGFVDDFDVFVMYYDHNRDGQVVLSPACTAGTPAQGRTPEFFGSNNLPIDDDLALLIDSARPDRNKNGIYGYTDTNHNGRYDPGEPLQDVEEVDPAHVPPELSSYVFLSGGLSYVYRDQVLGFRDGVLDRRDQYAKVGGRLMFRTTESQWLAAQGNYMDRLRGPIVPEYGAAPVTFGVSSARLPDLNNTNFTNSQTGLRAAANGGPFDQQVAANLGVSVAALATWTPANNSSDPDAPHYFPLLPDGDNDGRPDNWQTAYFEKMPFNSPNYYDYYYRPVYENMIFRDVQIPQGTNALFKKCQFIGVTWVRCATGNTHVAWSLYGKMRIDPSTGRPGRDPARFEYTGTFFPTMLAPNDRPVLMATTPVDKADIPSDQVPYTIGYSSLPDPLIINGLRCLDTKKLSNNLRFHDCLMVGSIVSDSPTAYTQVRNKLQFTGATKFVQENPDHPGDPSYNPEPTDLEEIAKSTLMLPNYSVDLGNFNSPQTQNIQLKGAIVAGVLDVRGNADIAGVLMLTFRPVLGEVPLLDARGEPAGNPAMFNATIGYFGPNDGDDESLDPMTLPIVNGERIVGWDTDNDGLPDVPPTQPQPPGSQAVPFYGYGKINIRFTPSMTLPDGILLPLQVDARRGTYQETAR